MPAMFFVIMCACYVTSILSATGLSDREMAYFTLVFIASLMFSLHHDANLLFYFLVYLLGKSVTVLHVVLPSWIITPSPSRYKRRWQLVASAVPCLWCARL